MKTIYVFRNLVVIAIFANCCSIVFAITGGREVSESGFIRASVVALKNSNGRVFCTGTLISMRHVVTAAHCLHGLAGPYSVGFGSRKGFGRLHPVARHVTHPRFNTALMSGRYATLAREPVNDVAVVELDQSVAVDAEPAPVLSPKSSLPLRNPLTLVGYGATSFDAKDRGVLRFVETMLLQLNPMSDEILFGPTPGRSSCQGDSGGPAFVKDIHHRYVLSGVISRGTRCTGKGVIADIRSYMPWIKSVMKGDSWRRANSHADRMNVEEVEVEL